tara:strand:+ start:11740 stop:12756 length:1017 start_codon:yes stop_codon:yes gene_type:complete
MKGHFNNERDFGVEIEFLRPRGISQQQVSDALNNMNIQCRVEGYNHTTRTHWKIVGDSSVNTHTATHLGDNEIVSPRLRGQDGLDELQKVCDVLQLLGCVVNKTCGIHIHHDVTNIVRESDSSAKKFITNLVLFCAKYEHIIYKLVSPSRLDGRNYSVPVRRTFFSRGELSRVNVIDSLSLTNLKSELLNKVVRVVNDKVMNGTLQPNRSCGLNLLNVWSRGSVEFRYHNGSLNFEKIKSWIVVTNAIVNSVESTNFVKLSNVPSGARGLASFRGAIGFVGRSGNQDGTPYTNDQLTKDANLFIQRRYRANNNRTNQYARHYDYRYVSSGMFHNVGER